MEHVLSLSYGKDSLSCLGAVEELGWPLDRIVHAEVWATATIPADLPPMVEFKTKADKIIKERWGIEVEHYSAEQSYEDVFYRRVKAQSLEKRKSNPNFRGFGRLEIYGFPAALKGSWCVSEIKVDPLKRLRSPDDVTYLGIAADEPDRFHNLTPTQRSPLVELGWTEADCWKWCEENDLLSPIYTYPELWELMLKWDEDSPVTFHPDGRTVHDFERCFAAEDAGVVPKDRRFRWDMLDQTYLGGV